MGFDNGMRANEQGKRLDQDDGSSQPSNYPQKGCRSGSAHAAAC